MGETAKALDAAFVISVGDNFYEDGVASIDDPKWKTSFEDVYTAPSLQIPWYVALGNHDYHGNTQAQLDYAQASKRWNMLGRWYGSRQTSDQQGPGRRRPLRARHLPLHRRLPRRRREEGEGRRPAHGAAAKVARRRAGPVHRGLEGRRRPPPDLFGRRTWRARRLARTDGAAGPDPAAPSHPALPPRHEHDLQHIVRGATHYVCTGAGSLARKHCHGAGGDFCSVQSGFTACAASGDGLHVVEITRTA